MRRTTKTIWRLVVITVGFPILLLGLILLPLPGPGLLVSFLGLLILSTEFGWAQKRLARIKDEIKKIAGKRSDF